MNGKIVMMTLICLVLASFVNATETCVDLSVPSAPNGISVTENSVEQVTITWGEATDEPHASNPECPGIDYYNVYRSVDDAENFVIVDETTGLTYTDSDVSEGSTYYYRVTAVDSVWDNPNEGDHVQTSATVGGSQQNNDNNNPPPSTPTYSGGGGGGGSAALLAQYTESDEDTEQEEEQGDGQEGSTEDSEPEEETTSGQDNVASAASSAEEPIPEQEERKGGLGAITGNIIGFAKGDYGMIGPLIIAGLALAGIGIFTWRKFRK